MIKFADQGTSVTSTTRDGLQKSERGGTAGYGSMSVSLSRMRKRVDDLHVRLDQHVFGSEDLQSRTIKQTYLGEFRPGKIRASAASGRYVDLYICEREKQIRSLCPLGNGRSPWNN